MNFPSDAAFKVRLGGHRTVLLGHNCVWMSPVGMCQWKPPSVLGKKTFESPDYNMVFIFWNGVSHQMTNHTRIHPLFQTPGSPEKQTSKLPVLIEQFITITSITIAATHSETHLLHYRHQKSILSFSKHFEVHYCICSPGLYLRKDGEWLLSKMMNEENK